MRDDRDVLVHTCHERNTDPRRLPQFNLRRKYYTDDPKFSSFLPLPEKCKCKKMVTRLMAGIMLEKGQALRVYKPPLVEAKSPEEGLRYNYENLDTTQIVSVVNRAQTPRVDVITKADVERAYVSGSVEDIEHIEEVHAMLVEGLIALTVEFRTDPQEGRLLFPFGPDQRTVGGH
jgi:hypothetical protein